MFTRQLAEIVDYIDQLGTFEGMTPEPGDRLAQPGEDEDRPAPCLPREAFLANAPAVLDGFLRVPEVKVGRRDDS